MILILIKPTFSAIIAILGMIGTMGVTDAMVTYASSDSDNNDDEITDPLNQACYRSCFNDGDQSTPYNQTVFSQCRPDERAYYEGFISGCIVGRGIEYFACNQIAK